MATLTLPAFSDHHYLLAAAAGEARESLSATLWPELAELLARISQQPALFRSVPAEWVGFALHLLNDDDASAAVAADGRRITQTAYANLADRRYAHMSTPPAEWVEACRQAPAERVIDLIGAFMASTVPSVDPAVRAGAAEVLDHLLANTLHDDLAFPDAVIAAGVNCEQSLVIDALRTPVWGPNHVILALVSGEDNTELVHDLLGRAVAPVLTSQAAKLVAKPPPPVAIGTTGAYLGCLLGNAKVVANAWLDGDTAARLLARFDDNGPVRAALMAHLADHSCDINDVGLAARVLACVAGDGDAYDTVVAGFFGDAYTWWLSNVDDATLERWASRRSADDYLDNVQGDYHSHAWRRDLRAMQLYGPGIAAAARDGQLGRFAKAEFVSVLAELAGNQPLLWRCINELLDSDTTLAEVHNAARQLLAGDPAASAN